MNDKFQKLLDKVPWKVYVFFKKLIQRLFYRYEVELYREGMKPIYGIRAVYRSRIACVKRGIKWRAYGGLGFKEHVIQMPINDLRRILKESETFLREKI